MSEETVGSKIEPCPASRDRAYITVNTVLWVLGAFGMYWMTDESPLNLIMPAAYLGLNFAFFRRIFGNNELGICPFFRPGHLQVVRDRNSIDIVQRLSLSFA